MSHTRPLLPASYLYGVLRQMKKKYIYKDGDDHQAGFLKGTMSGSSGITKEMTSGKNGNVASLSFSTLLVSPSSIQRIVQFQHSCAEHDPFTL